MCELIGFTPTTVTASQLTPWHTRWTFETVATRRVSAFGVRIIERLGRLGARTAALIDRRRELEVALAQSLRATNAAGRMLKVATERSEASAAAVASERQTRRALNHAIRTPLNHVVAATSLLVDLATDSPTLNTLLDEIDQTSTELLAVVAKPSQR